MPPEGNAETAKQNVSRRSLFTCLAAAQPAVSDWRARRSMMRCDAERDRGASPKDPSSQQHAWLAGTVFPCAGCVVGLGRRFVRNRKICRVVVALSETSVGLARVA